MKVSLMRKLLLIFLTSFACIGSYSWFTTIQRPGLNPDEAVWIAMTEFYTYRKEGNWKKFHLNQIPQRKGWANEKNVLLDQPQTGKYLFGLILDLTQQNPWDHKNLTYLYTDFSQSKIQTHESLYESKEYLGTAFKPIQTLRLFSSTIGWITFLIFAYLIFLLTNDVIAGLATFNILLLHPTFLNYFRKAMMDSLSAFFILSSICVLSLSKYYSTSLFKKLLCYMFSGILSAFASSIKMNGLFLLALPFFFLVSDYLSLEQKNKKHLFNIFCCMMIFMAGFFMTFYFLEPVLWVTPIKGFQGLIQTRLQQQQSFYLTFGEKYFFILPSHLLYTFFSNVHILVMLPLFAFLFTGIYNSLIKLKKQKNIFSISHYSYSYFLQTFTMQKQVSIVTSSQVCSA